MRSRRVDIVQALARVPEGLSVSELLGRLGGSDAGMRRDLEALCATGVVASLRDEPTGPGRPRIRFQLARTTGGWQEIVSLLVGLLGASESLGDDAIREFGRDRARRMLESGDREALSAFMARLGFSPQDESSVGDRHEGVQRLRFANCPFRDAVAAEGGRAVCALHHGLVQGAADNSGRVVTVFEPRDPFAAGCEAVVAPGA